MAVTADEYELPVAIADTCKELAKLCGVSRNTIRHAMQRGWNGKRTGRKFIKVEVNDDHIPSDKEV